MKYYNEDLETAFSIRYPEEPIQTDAAKEVVENYEYSEPGKSGDIEEFLNRDFGSKEKSSTIYAAQAGEKGTGLFADAEIKEGTVIGEYTGVVRLFNEVTDGECFLVMLNRGHHRWGLVQRKRAI